MTQRIRSRRRYLAPLALALTLAVAGPISAQSLDGGTLQLETSEQRPWTLPADLERVAIADPAVANIVTTKNKRQALLVGGRAGQTTLLLWHRGNPNPQRIQVSVRSHLQQGLLGDNSPTVTLGDGGAILTGNTDTLLDHQQAYKAAALTSGDGKVTDVSTISNGSGGVVQVEVKIVEVNKTVLRQMGVNFHNANGGFSYSMNTGTSGGGSSSGNGGGDSGSGGNSGSNPVSAAFSLVANSLTHNWGASINLLQSNGMARTLAEPTLVALSGQSASFLAGGELPILVPQSFGTTTVEYKPFGIGLTVTPTVLSPDRIALKVAPEASDLDYANSVTYQGVQVPSITTRRADTTIELGDGESFIIGGLISHNLTSVVSKVPLLGDIPIIGTFFRSLDYKKQDKELVIMVTPKLVKPIARGTEIKLPGEREAQPNLPVWGSYLLYPASPDQLPGFSR